MIKRITGVEARPPGEVEHRADFRLRCGGLLSVLAAIAILAGCATSNRGEAIFMQQHRASIALTEAVMAAEYDNPEIIDQLYDGEDGLGRACGPIQEIGYRKMNQVSVDPMLRMAAYDSLDACAVETAAVEALLWQVDPETARHFLDQPLVSAMAAE